LVYDIIRTNNLNVVAAMLEHPATRSKYIGGTSMAKSIPLNKGMFALVDDGDFERLNQYKWRVAKIGNTYYAERGGSTGIRMHRDIMGSMCAGKLVDHSNGNGLDNRRCNLRVCTISQNAMNGRRATNNTSGYKGVNYHKCKRRYRATIKKDGKSKHIGLYDTAEAAARAYDKAARMLFGEFARVNFPESDT
jgi:hypothetical protein